MTWSADGGWTLNHNGLRRFTPDGVCFHCGRTFANAAGGCDKKSGIKVLHGDVVTALGEQ